MRCAIRRLPYLTAKRTPEPSATPVAVPIGVLTVVLLRFVVVVHRAFGTNGMLQSNCPMLVLDMRGARSEEIGEASEREASRAQMTKENANMTAVIPGEI